MPGFPGRPRGVPGCPGALVAPGCAAPVLTPQGDVSVL